MRAWLMALAALIAAVAALARPAQAETRVALVIGNSAYRNVEPLATPAKDAAAIAEMLRGSGFDTVDLATDLDLAEFGAAIRQFEDRARGADIAAIFYAGYGLQIGGANYLLPVDARLATARDAAGEAVALQRLARAAENARSMSVVLIDAARDNPLFSEAIRNIGQPGLAIDEPAKPDVLMAFAHKAGPVGDDGGTDHSAYTRALLRHLVTPGLDIRLALGRVRDDVAKQTGNRQEPFVYGTLDGAAHPLVPERADAPANADDVRQDFELVSKIATRRAYEIFLGAHPTGYYADIVRGYLGRLGGGSPAGVERRPFTEPNWGDDIFMRRHLAPPKTP